MGFTVLSFNGFQYQFLGFPTGSEKLVGTLGRCSLEENKAKTRKRNINCENHLLLAEPEWMVLVNIKFQESIVVMIMLSSDSMCSCPESVANSLNFLINYISYTLNGPYTSVNVHGKYSLK